MGGIWNAIGDYWWLIFVVGGSVGGVTRGIGAWNERRAQRRLERYRIKQEASVARAEAESRGRVDSAAVQAELAAAAAEHERTDETWFAYETDLATLLDYPMLVDLREPLTETFHRDRSRAELLRPAPDSTDQGAVRSYRDAVHAYSTSLAVAEQEAKRRRRNDFSPVEQERLARAQRLLALAMNDAASGEERRQAYARARSELDGLIALPTAGAAALERRVQAAIEAG
ncbi:hypothetical protein L5G32_17505 [Gordonia sp. HY002]|uniref:hypothetical protein n=1 Tax=Gordonia zhenghanii TaxID=2911516 RepID=UPI001EF0E479|nr:hypothetical protein [Gordonia zhenghanii]MCF8572067.1 hypothetical protein [Gordonia zhenghanii]MCF8602941.1 hypothetical protein [Gordonia zhenghanii]